MEWHDAMKGDTPAPAPATIRCAECDCEKGGADCNWIAKPAPAVKVKALVWEDPCAANNHIYMARAPWGTYGIHIDGGRHRAWLEAHEKPYERWLGDADVGSAYEAQAAAQADYEARIMSALETATPLDDPRVKALVEALSLIAVVGYSDDPKVNAAIAKQTVDQARAALSALEENK